VASLTASSISPTPTYDRPDGWRNSAVSRTVAPSTPSTPPQMNAMKIRWAVSTSSARANAYTTNVTGIRKLPRRMIVGTRLGLPVANVTTTVATHRPRPPSRTRAQGGRRCRTCRCRAAG